jgi:hypothetical protein
MTADAIRRASVTLFSKQKMDRLGPKPTHAVQQAEIMEASAEIRSGPSLATAT